MKLIEFKEFNKESIIQAINKRKLVITICVSVILLIILTFILLYIYNKDFRRWADTHVLMKVVYEGSLSSIEIDKSENISIYAYDKYVSIINGSKLEIYNSSGKSVATHDVIVSTPVYSANGKYLVIGDKGKQKIYLLSGTKIAWETEIEGSISTVSVNENGYVSAVYSGSTYKSIVSAYDASGKQLFKTFIPSNIVVDSTISSDNKLLSFAEIDTNKTAIESTVKTISIKDASTATSNTEIQAYGIPDNGLVVNVKYQGSKNLICMSDKGIYSLGDGNIKQLVDFNEQNKKYNFAGINLANTMYVVDESSDGLSNQYSNVILTNTSTKKNYSYVINGIAKSTASADDNIAINLGSEVYFINSRGWLIKQYIASEEVRDIIVSDRLAAIIFRDKIEILIL